MEAPDEQAEELRRRQGEAWRTRFEDLLEDAPEAEAPLRELVAFIAEHSSGPAVAGAVQVNAEAHDQSQQAVQGQGVQNITFGSQPKP